mmetsp:Transcript_96985/g.145309  ORF Transcript_96985/g.145309 Transcript_96985/m.145309 type:complete len:315 (+) Transcript_96985:258-1202(+)
MIRSTLMEHHLRQDHPRVSHLRHHSNSSKLLPTGDPHPLHRVKARRLRMIHSPRMVHPPQDLLHPAILLAEHHLAAPRHRPMILSVGTARLQLLHPKPLRPMTLSEDTAPRPNNQAPHLRAIPTAAPGRMVPPRRLRTRTPNRHKTLMLSLEHLVNTGLLTLGATRTKVPSSYRSSKISRMHSFHRDINHLPNKCPPKRPTHFRFSTKPPPHLRAHRLRVRAPWCQLKPHRNKPLLRCHREKAIFGEILDSTRRPPHNKLRAQCRRKPESSRQRTPPRAAESFHLVANITMQGSLHRLWVSCFSSHRSLLTPCS